MTVNLVAVSGNVTSEPRRIQTQKGDTMFALRLAVYSGKGKDGQTETMFFDVTLFSVKDWMEAELSKVTKGSPVVVTGRLRLNRYQAKDGTMVDAISITADSITPLMSRNATETVTVDADPFA